MSLVALPILSLGENFGLVYQGVNIAVGGLVVARITWLSIRGGSLELRVITVALTLVLAAGVHDLALFGQFTTPESVWLLSYSGMLLFGAFLFAIQRRYAHAINEHERLSESLAQRLSAREPELQARHVRLIEHDGLGSALTTSLAMVEQKEFDGEELKAALCEGVDELRAVIDSLEPLDGDLISVLATLRFRLGRRMEWAGITLGGTCRACRL
jgi:hypothetical protein